MTAVKHTQDRYIYFLANDYPITFDNISMRVDNFSTLDGICMLVFNIFFYNLLGFLIDYYFYAP